MLCCVAIGCKRTLKPNLAHPDGVGLWEAWDEEDALLVVNVNGARHARLDAAKGPAKTIQGWV